MGAQVSRPTTSNSVAVGKTLTTSAPSIDLMSAEINRAATAVQGAAHERAVAYNGDHLPLLYDPRTGKIQLHTEFVDEFSYDPLPVRSSDLILTARITTAIVHLSADGSRVFSSYSLAPLNTIKGSLANNESSSLQADRAGGVVVLPGGQRKFVGVAERGLPELGRSYLLFLQKTPTKGVYEIRTGYLLDGNQVSALDREGDKYDSLDTRVLLQKLSDTH